MSGGGNGSRAITIVTLIDYGVHAVGHLGRLVDIEDRVVLLGAVVRVIAAKGGRALPSGVALVVAAKVHALEEQRHIDRVLLCGRGHGCLDGVETLGLRDSDPLGVVCRAVIGGAHYRSVAREGQELAIGCHEVEHLHGVVGCRHVADSPTVSRGINIGIASEEVVGGVVGHTRVERVGAILEGGHREIETVVVKRSLGTPAVTGAKPLLRTYIIKVVFASLQRGSGLLHDGVSRHGEELELVLVAAHDGCDRLDGLGPSIVVGEHLELVVDLHGVGALHGVVGASAVDELSLTEFHELRQHVGGEVSQSDVLRGEGTLGDGHLVEVGAVVGHKLRRTIVGRSLADDGAVEHLSLLEVEARAVEKDSGGAVLHVDVVLAHLGHVGVSQREAHGAVLGQSVERGDVGHIVKRDDLHARRHRLAVGVVISDGDAVDLAL